MKNTLTFTDSICLSRTWVINGLLPGHASPIIIIGCGCPITCLRIVDDYILAILVLLSGIHLLKLIEYGEFLDWGLLKDLFVPFREQRVKMQIGKSYVVYIYIDELTGRIVGSSRISRHLQDVSGRLMPHQQVDALIFKRTQLGYKAVIPGPDCEGMIYSNELFQPLAIGDEVKAFVKNIRPDGKVDLVLQEGGRRHVEDFSVVLLRNLTDKANHFVALNDKSDPQDIYDMFGVSKKTFKRAVGALYKERLIDITDDGIRLL